MIKFKDPKINDLLAMYKEELVMKEKLQLKNLKSKLEKQLSIMILNETEKLEKMKLLQKVLMGEFNINKQQMIKKSISNICEVINNLNGTINDCKNEIDKIKDEADNININVIKFETIADFIHSVISNQQKSKKYIKRITRYANKYLNTFNKEISNDNLNLICKLYCVFEDESSLEIIFKIPINEQIDIDKLNINNLTVSKSENENLQYLTFRLNKDYDWEFLDPINNHFKKYYALEYSIKHVIERVQRKLINNMKTTKEK